MLLANAKTRRELFDETPEKWFVNKAYDMVFKLMCEKENPPYPLIKTLYRPDRSLTRARRAFSLSESNMSVSGKKNDAYTTKAETQGKDEDSLHIPSS